MHSYKPLKPTPGVLADSAGLDARKARGLSALRRSIERHAKPSESDWQAMESFLRPLVLSSGEYFARQGERPQRLGFIISGLVRVFYSTPAGVERIVIFRDEGRPVSAYFAYLEGGLSPFSIQAIEDSFLLVAMLRDITALTSRHPYWAGIAADYTRALFTEKEQRERELLSMSAAQRYEMFKERYPGIEARVKQHHVAAYLGITPVALSRIRAAAARHKTS